MTAADYSPVKHARVTERIELAPYPSTDRSYQAWGEKRATLEERIPQLETTHLGCEKVRGVL